MRTMFLLSALALPLAAAAVPSEMTHQGRLFDAAGVPLDGPQSVTLSLFEDPTGGTELWTETQVLTLNNGYYVALLGENSSNPVVDSDLDRATMWLEIAVGTNPPLSRLAVSSVPYARLAGAVDFGNIANLPADLSDGSDADTLAALGCAAGERAESTGSGWACVPTTTLSALSCADGEVATYNSTWGCGPSDTLSSLTCSPGEVAAAQGSGWGCAPNTDTTYSAGTGLTLIGDAFTLNTTVEDLGGPTRIATTATLAPGESLAIDHVAVPTYDVQVTVWRDSGSGSYELAPIETTGSSGLVEFGGGVDGSVTVTGTVLLDQAPLASARTSPDAVAYNLTALTGTTATLTGPPAGIIAGDEVLLINLQGTSSSQTNVGNYDFLTVSDVTGSVVTFTSPKTKSYGDAGGDTNIGTAGSNQRVVLQRVPHYTDMTVSDGAVLTASAWNGTSGGVLALRVAGTLAFLGSGAMEMSELGYRGGDCNGCGNNAWGDQGEGIGGTGNGSSPANYNGGGGGYGPSGIGGSPGAGGGHGSAGGNGLGDGGAPTAVGGSAVGGPELARIFMGGGGGGGGDNDNATPLPQNVNGGGIAYVAAVAVTGANIHADGEDANPSCNSGGYGVPGAGAGGTVWVTAANLDITDLTAAGGPNCVVGADTGGFGGEGRVRLDYAGLSGSSTPAAFERTLDQGGVLVSQPDDSTVVVENAGLTTDSYRVIITAWP